MYYQTTDRYLVFPLRRKVDHKGKKWKIENEKSGEQEEFQKFICLFTTNNIGKLPFYRASTTSDSSDPKIKIKGIV